MDMAKQNMDIENAYVCSHMYMHEAIVVFSTTVYQRYNRHIGNKSKIDNHDERKPILSWITSHISDKLGLRYQY